MNFVLYTYNLQKYENKLNTYKRQKANECLAVNQWPSEGVRCDVDPYLLPSAPPPAS